MKPSANIFRLALSVVFGVTCLAALALWIHNDLPARAQDEPVRFVGRNFSDVRPQNPAQPDALAAPSQTTTELSVDDGTFEAAVGVSGGGTPWGVNRLTPTSYPSTITGVAIFFQTQQGLTAGSPITILVGTNPSGGANINNIT
ncbi:MAG: hypothetical protein ACREAM_28185, partial [Blastocatellia bacterium]